MLELMTEDPVKKITGIKMSIIEIKNSSLFLLNSLEIFIF